MVKIPSEPDGHSPVLPDPVVQVVDLCKSRRGRPVLEDLSFSIGRGRVFGLIGPNGAGKTTTIQVLIGLLRPDAGRVEVFGEAPRQLSVANRQRIGYLAEDGWEGRADLPIGELLEYHSHYFASWDWDWCRELIDRVGVVQDRSLSDLSKGEQRKAELVVALAHRPELLILDDPAIGLDATVRRDMLWATVAAAKQDGCTVLFTSHVLQDVERIVDDVLILDRGRVRQAGTLAAVREAVRRLVFPAGYEVPPIEGELARERRGDALTVITDRFSPALVAALRRGSPNLQVEELSLEEIFCAVVGPTPQGAEGGAA